MKEIVSNSPEETVSLGRQWGRAAGPGWIFGLQGDLGAGKTQLVRGIAEGLGVTERVHSPTFVLVNLYETGRIPLFHLDLYRLDTPEQVESSGLLEYFQQRDAVTVVEWVDRWSVPPVLPNPAQPYRFVILENISENGRRIRYEDFGI